MTPQAAGPLGGEERAPAPLHLTLLLALAGLKLAIHLATQGAYGFHRDELYYLACGAHPAWGYVDHPPLAPWVARLVSEIAGPSLRALRLVPALLGAACVFLAGGMAARLGGGRFAQALAAVAVIASPMYLLSGTMFQTVGFDQLAWTLAIAVALEALLAGRPRLWLAFGLVAGLGVLAKYTFLALALGLSVGLALAARRELRSPWLWAGAALAIAMVLPNLQWQAAHGWPTPEFIRENRADDDITRVQFVIEQVFLMGLGAAPLAIAGLVALFSLSQRRVRPLGWAAVIVLALFVATRAKSYYAAALYPLLFAAGAAWLEARVEAWRRAWLRPAAFAAVALGSAAFVPVALPVLPVDALARRQHDLPVEDFQNMIGWPELARQVAGYYHALPEEERRGLRIATTNYGTSGAIDLYGPALGLPAAISGHDTYSLWERHPALDPLITVGYGGFRLRQRFAEVESLGAVATPHGIVNEETGRGIFYVRGLQIPADSLWARMRHFD